VPTNKKKGGTLTMEIQLDLNGRKRKEAADCIGTALGCASVYQRAPSYAYLIRKDEKTSATLDRNGVLTLPDTISKKAQTAILTALRSAGFLPEDTKEAVTTENVANATDVPVPIEPDRLTIQMPLADFSDTALENIEKLVASKATLLKKAIATDDLTILRNSKNNTLDFPWFNMNATPEEALAYAQLVSALGDMAKQQTRILATDKSVENEKYAFRCFLLRLGFIGETYATSRKVLLQHLTGNGSFKSGVRKAQAQTAITAAANPASQSGNATIDAKIGKNGAQGESEADRPSTSISDLTRTAKPRFSLRKLFGALKVMALD
jgi:hypothetical protein